MSFVLIAACVLLASPMAAQHLLPAASATESVDAFISQWNGHFPNYDGLYGSQCVDLFDYYNRDVVGAPAQQFGHAYSIYGAASPSFYDKHPAGDGYVPVKGDVAVWNGTSSNQFGHVAIVLASVNSTTINVLAANWYGTNDGPPTPGLTSDVNNTPVMTGNHSTANLEGYLHPHSLSGGTPPPSTWHPWESLATGVSSGTGVSSWGPGRLDVFWVGSDHHLWHKWYDGAWHSPESLGGNLVGTPSAVSWNGARVDVFAKGNDSSSTLQHKWWSSTTGWSGWEALATGVSTGTGVSSWGTGRLDVFWVGFDHHLWHKWYDGAWHSPESLGGNLVGTPSAVSSAPWRIDIFAQGYDTNNTLQHEWYG